MRLLLVNANTTQAVTDAVVREGRRCASHDTEIVGVTARFGANIVTAHPENTIAAYAALDLLASQYHSFDAAILAISFDSGLFAARDLLPIPVIGMTEAALHMACMLSRRFGVITFGGVSRPLYDDLFASYGLESRIATIHTIELGSVKDYLTTQTLHGAILEAAGSMQKSDGAEVVLICGAALAGIAHQLQSQSPVILLDGVPCAIRQAEALVRLGLPSWPGVRAELARSCTVSGVSAELAQLLDSGSPNTVMHEPPAPDAGGT
jgi:allantoin racemase